eukprot:gene23283-43762_t
MFRDVPGIHPNSASRNSRTSILLSVPPIADYGYLRDYGFLRKVERSGLVSRSLPHGEIRSGGRVRANRSRREAMRKLETRRSVGRSFRGISLGGASVLALLLPVAGPAQAAEAPKETQIEELVVTS